MEELPLQGRNWMELSKLVKGITANDVANTPGVGRDDVFQLNLDGQQITQKIAGSGFGQPRFSRESIAEFQIVTNMFDITQGRSAGMQVQAISHSGTNNMAGSVYGFFRDDKFNAPDRRQPRAAVSEPADRRRVRRADRARTRCTTSRRTNTSASRARLHVAVDAARPELHASVQEQPEELPGARRRSAVAERRLSVRGSRWDWENPFVLGAGGHPSNASVQTKNATNVARHLVEGAER